MSAAPIAPFKREEPVGKGMWTGAHETRCLPSPGGRQLLRLQSSPVSTKKEGRVDGDGRRRVAFAKMRHAAAASVSAALLLIHPDSFTGLFETCARSSSNGSAP